MNDLANEQKNGLSPQEEEILRAVRGLHYGSVIVTVHEHRIVEVSRQEKIRFQPSPGKKN